MAILYITSVNCVMSFMIMSFQKLDISILNAHYNNKLTYLVVLRYQTIIE